MRAAISILLPTPSKSIPMTVSAGRAPTSIERPPEKVIVRYNNGTHTVTTLFPGTIGRGVEGARGRITSVKVYTCRRHR